MDYIRLGATGLRVSRLALGCMSYGDPTTLRAHEWSLNDDEGSRSSGRPSSWGHVLGHGERVSSRDVGGAGRPRDQALFATRGHRAGNLI